MAFPLSTGGPSQSFAKDSAGLAILRFPTRLSVAGASLKTFLSMTQSHPAAAGPAVCRNLLRWFSGLLLPLAMAGAVRAQAVAPPGTVPVVTYKIKLSEGTAWTNLNPESWVVFEVSNGQQVSLRHTTNTVNMITGLSRWWDHPILESRACRSVPAVIGRKVGACLTGKPSATPGSGSHVFTLPAGDSIHDYLFELKWKERGAIQEARTQVPRGTSPASVRQVAPPAALTAP